jgi:hypothetical protein
LYSNWYDFNSASANPDYICIKNESNWVCYINRCDDWNIDGSRVCHWIKYLKTAYYSTRVGCQEWGTAYYVWGNNWASGRRTADFPLTWNVFVWYKYERQCDNSDYCRFVAVPNYVSGESESCSITEYDNVPPSWDSVNNVVN